MKLYQTTPPLERRRVIVQRQQLKRLENRTHRDDSRLTMKSQLIAIVAAVLVVGCGETQQSAPAPEAKPVEPVAEAATPEPPTAKAPDIDIHDAAEEGNVEAVKQHLAAGTDPNLANLGERFLGDFIKPPLHFSKNKEVAELLIAGGADVNFKDQTGWAILHYWSFSATG